jgi:SAM-dependent methyltransferase
VREPLQELEYRSSMPRLTEIEDKVSLAVRQQYEENPFPRWVKAAPVAKPVPLDKELRRKFPSASFHDLGKTADLDYLVAGCGTGRGVEEDARTFAGARVLAVDLSRASLAYAKRKADEAKLTNVDFAQADILKLASVGRTFDGIDCSGVLHHMAEPLQGWRVLLSLLRPGGFMRVGLYSEIARKDIVAAQRFASERGYGSTDDDIRRCRQEILDLPSETPVRNVIKMRDFFTTSGCRDLLFHAQEHRLTIPEIARFVADSGLVFLGFELHRSILERFEKSFPQAGSAQDLLLWHAFEQKNPRTFIAMYQFWVQKRAA